MTSEGIKEQIEEFLYKKDKLSVENDHVLKGNKILSENSRLIKNFIDSVQINLKKAEEFVMDISKDKVNIFNSVDTILLHKKLENYEEMLETCIKLGEFTNRFSTKATKFVARPFKLAYIHSASENKRKLEKYRDKFQKPKSKEKRVDYNFDILKDSDQKIGNVINEIFQEMKTDGKLLKYMQNKTSRIKKLRAIRDYYQHLND